jgi:hypothetical protein
VAEYGIAEANGQQFCDLWVQQQGLLYFGFDPVITLPIDGSSPASDDYQELFSTAIIDNKISTF